MEWHVWDFPDEIRINFTAEFRQRLFIRLKEVCGSRYALAKSLNLHPMTVKEYELARSTTNLPVLLPVKFIKAIKMNFGESLTKEFEEMENFILSYRCKNKGLFVHKPILPIKESPSLYSTAIHILADGCASKRNLPYYCNKNKTLIKNFIKNLEIFGEVQQRYFTRSDGQLYIYFATAISRILEFLLCVKFVRPESFPEILIKASSENRIASLRAFMDDEGSVTGGKIYVTQKSAHILTELKELFDSFNIKTSKIYKKQYGHQFIILSESHEAYYKIISFDHPKKKKRLYDIVRKKQLRGIPIKYRVLDIVTKRNLMNTREVANTLNLPLDSVREALTTLKTEGKLLNQTTNSRKPKIWFTKASFSE